MSSLPSLSGRDDISLIVITSPSPSNPSTELINHAIQSCSLVDGLQNCPTIIVMDGYKVFPVSKPKLGRITAEMAEKYEQYHVALLERYCDPRFSVLRCPSHHGFALAVKAGLEACNTKYAIIAQHDRVFCTSFPKLGLLIETMEARPHIRYIGFPTSTNISHDKFISTNYNLYCLNKPEVKQRLEEHLYLQPVVFWFDSQHLAHVQRYLQIYQPFTNIPPHLQEIIGVHAVKSMVLRSGDFIEDRFGQSQRRLLWTLATTPPSQLAQLKTRVASTTPTAIIPATAAFDSATAIEAATEEPLQDSSSSSSDLTQQQQQQQQQHVSYNAQLVVEMFRWFGSYLCWINTSDTPYNVHAAQGKNDTVVMVRHMRGRQLDDVGIAWKINSFATGGGGVAKGGYLGHSTHTGVGATAVDTGKSEQDYTNVNTNTCSAPGSCSIEAVAGADPGRSCRIGSDATIDNIDNSGSTGVVGRCASSAATGGEL
jgi:hypothetical protein